METLVTLHIFAPKSNSILAIARSIESPCRSSASLDWIFDLQFAENWRRTDWAHVFRSVESKSRNVLSCVAEVNCGRASEEELKSKTEPIETSLFFVFVYSMMFNSTIKLNWTKGTTTDRRCFVFIACVGQPEWMASPRVRHNTTTTRCYLQKYFVICTEI